ncbi:NAD(P)/FAD-dependent oxidoreductase [Phytomonospora endophytica]|uniref:NADH dehydrogenase FAD-containing subunit n=1 Tax=Phytomonospora endophytica TaxID=714109 RepID=A0A841FMG2_9ACTN|nr:FAD-dependent oxidoreductase [Phytomonospora endophytica]MBB6033799.1 NADH dehydrogenase FAD-containing subunit [Phytomonospora endophytica]GIG64683.1 oxidoreductase [Phytomonospora endophytica]
MKHHIVVLGAGYAGAYAAGNLARGLSPADTAITVVNAEPDFVERLRLHQLAAGRTLASKKLADVFAGTAIGLRVARVTALDPDRRTVTVADSGGGAELGYDTLLYTLGSHVADHGVAGVREHAFNVAARPSALRLRDRLDALGTAGKALIVGDGLTGIETATELAESRPGLSVTLLARGELGARLSLRARGHLRRACTRLGVTVVEHAEVTAVEADRVRCADGSVHACDATVWAAGFTVGPIAAAGGLDVTADGRIIVDRVMRSVSHEDVYAAGDSVHAIGDNGLPMPMSCGSAGYTARQAVNAIMGRLTGGRIDETALAYSGNHITLGRRDAILQSVDAQARATPRYVGGRAAALVKEGINRVSLWTVSHPTFGLPTRTRRTTQEQPVAGAGGVSA